VLSANDPGCGQAAALAGAAPVTTKVPAVAKRVMLNLEWLRMIKKIDNKNLPHMYGGCQEVH
jgi:hypothetical protein